MATQNRKPAECKLKNRQPCWLQRLRRCRRFFQEPKCASTSETSSSSSWMRCTIWLQANVEPNFHWRLSDCRLVTGKEFQRIGLSATVGNPQEIAKFIAGTRRKISIIQASPEKSYRYNVENPSPIEVDYEMAGKLETSPEAASRIRRILELVDSHKSTLIFVNSRTVAEVLGHKLQQLNRDDIAVHHGSIRKEERIGIEDAFKKGQLKAIICTSTLELGIDIGNVDLVVQYMSPRQVNSLIQRVGRSGHRLDRASQGTIITVYPDDTLGGIGVD